MAFIVSIDIIFIHQFSIRQLSNLFIVFNVLQFPEAQHLETKVVPQCVDLATNCEYKDLYSLPFQL